jgi:hypothetical protein
MNDKFRYPEQRTPSVTPSRALWLLFVVAIAAGAWLMLSLAGTGTRPSVPEASTIFNGSDGMPVEETAQTF